MVIVDENRNSSSALTCLRLYNVKQEANETADDCFEKVKEIIKGTDLDIPDPVIDRAHRVGAGYNDKPPAMLVKFTTSRHRTKLYRARKEIKEKFGYSLQVDLAKEHLYTLKKVREIGKEHKDTTGFEFAYANVNCVLFMKISGRFEKFTTVEEANKLMGIIVNEEEADDNTEESSTSSNNSTTSSSSSGSGDDEHEKEDDGKDGNQGRDDDDDDDDDADDDDDDDDDDDEEVEDDEEDNDDEDNDNDVKDDIADDNVEANGDKKENEVNGRDAEHSQDDH